MERVYVKYALQVLGYKKRCSFNRWARLNAVAIYSDLGSNKHYVLKDEFHKAISMHPISHMHASFDVKAQPRKFNSYMKLTSELLSFKNERSKRGDRNGKGYIPSGEHEKDVLVKWTKNFHEL